MMVTLSGYQITRQLHESPNSKVYLGQHEQDHRPIVIKIFQSEYPTPQQLAQFHNEYEFTRALNIEGIRKAIEITEIEHKHAILLEYVAGETLKRTFVEQRQSLIDFLKVAGQIAETLGAVHQRNIIHKDINAFNILFDTQQQQIKIIDFGLASRINLKSYHLGNPGKLEGTLAYISPEQTGRMNRVVDYRTDLYSLGITFYEMLTGRLPFISDDPLELVHAHIAKNPVPPHEVRPEIPLIVSQIVMKLLAKNAEDRYQSAFGLKYDLDQCLAYLQGQISPNNLFDLNFELAQQDFSGRFQIPQKLYGRDEEIEILLRAFERVASLSASRNGRDGQEGVREEATLETSRNGEIKQQAELMLVAGYAGVGKSVLVHEVHKPITEKRGYFIEGKFDQFQRNIPYHAWAQAFRTWVNLLLTENETTLAAWRNKILSAAGNIGQILLEVIPNLELVIGPQPAVPELGAIEAQNRFNYLFQNFIKAIAQPEHPLVIFIDDWQWADPASLNLFKLLLSDASLSSLLLIGAYRNNEIDPTHPFMLALAELRQTGVAIDTIQLNNLSRDHVHALIADTLCSGDGLAGSAELQALSGLVYEKTLGNAFFVNEFLRSLYTEGLLQFDFGSATWRYDIAKIKALNITDNVVELLAGKVLKLPPAAQIYLKLAACIGNQFDLNTLAVIAEASPQEVQQNLIPALQEGVITLLPGLPGSMGPAGYQFVHDRIQQAAYSLIPDHAKQELHLKLGRLLLQSIPPVEREERIFEIVNQLNFGLILLDQPADKKELAELNLMAGRRAKMATAYEPAFNYFQTGLNLLGPDSWQTDYTLTLALYTEAAEMAYLTGNFEVMSRLTEAVLQRAANILDKVKAYEINISAKGGQNQAAEAISAAFECLDQLLGLTLPQSPTPADIQQGLQTIMAKMAGKRIEDLRDLPLMTDPHSQAATAILSLVGAVAYRSDIRLALLISLKMMELSLIYGNTQASPYAYASYGFVLCSVVQDIASGYRFGQLSLELVERLQAKAYHAKSLMVIQPLIKHWQDPARETLPILLEIYQLGLETGDLQAAGIGVAYYASYAYFVGTELGEFARQIEPYREALRKYKQTTSLNKINLYLQIALNLIHAADSPARLQGPIYHEDEMLVQHLAIRDNTTLCHHYLAQMTLSFIFEDYPQARAQAASAAQYISAAAGQLLIPIFHFYDALIHLANYPDLSETDQAAVLARITEHQQKMDKWAKHAPANHAHKLYLIEAERYRVLGEFKEAREYYDLAMQTAKVNAYMNEEALAAELAGKFYLARGDTFLGEVYLRRAYQGYQHWGATAKIKQLETKYPYFVRSTLATGAMTVSSTSTGQTTSRLLDLSTILRASHTLAGEVDLSQLLAQMIKLVVENAGAEQGFLLLEKDKAWYIEAEYRFQDQVVKVLHSIPIENGQDRQALFPTEIVNYVIAAKEVIVLNNAAEEGQFSRLPYMKQKQSKSVLCLPLLHQSKLAGILYLENNLITGAFTPERVELLNLLSSQMAISIENARLYTDLQQSEKKYRTIFEDSRDMIFITTAIGDVVDVSPACFSLLGYSRDEMIHRNAQEFYANPADRLKFRAEVEAHGAVKDMELKFCRRDGIEIDVLMTATTWKAEDGQLLGYQGIVRDITTQKRAEQERLRLSVVDQELSLAKNIQQSLLPPPYPGWTDLEVVCYSRPAREVGGDLYAYYLLTSPGGEEAGERKYAIAVGDVTGKGMPAALLMAVSLASLSSAVRQSLPPHKLLAQLDTTLVAYTHLSSQNCALVYVEITCSGDTSQAGTTNGSLLRLSNAGCPTPIIKRANGSVEWVEIGGLPLGVGLGAEIGYPEAEVRLSKGELLILTSDGLVEARKDDKEMFGFERLYHAIKAGPRDSAEAMLEFLKAEVTRFVGNLELYDDLTIVVIRG